jgi:hypothetical protein
VKVNVSTRHLKVKSAVMYNTGFPCVESNVDLVKDLDDVVVHKNSLDAAIRNVKTVKGGFVLTGNIAPIAHFTQKRHVKNRSHSSSNCKY